MNGYRRIIAALFTSIAAFAMASPAQAGLTISANADVIAGRNAFLAAGTTTTQFDWGSLFPPNTHTIGQLGPYFSVASTSVTLPDLSVNTVAGANAVPLALAFGNWVDAAGFNGPGGAAVADLAINGAESFDLRFGNGNRSVGFAIITGTGNFPSDVDLTGATFLFSAKDANDVLIGSAIFSLAAGRIDQAWLTITSDDAFQKLEVREIGAVGIADQYFSNILASELAVPDVSAVPEPGALGLVLMGFCGLLVSKRRNPPPQALKSSAWLPVRTKLMKLPSSW